MSSGQGSPREPDRQSRFAGLLEDAQSRLYGYIHMLVRNVTDADDVFQQTTVVMWRKFDSYDPRVRFLTWACGVARLEAMNHLRRRKRLVLLGDDVDRLLVEAFEQVPVDEHEGRRDALAECLKGLPERDRKLLRQCYLDSLPVREIAERLSRTPQSVHNSLRRIRQSLFQCVSRRLGGAAG
ncbi:MAG: sigma-70 family RNA polymerase sigma factor [Planctomycetota bacterium]